MELTRGYVLEHDEERYEARREKIYSFIKIPRELEKFMIYGFLQCADSFLYIYTFLPIRYALAVWALLTRPIARLMGVRRRRLLSPAEICDLLKGTIWLLCALVMLLIDPNILYHIIKSQSIIKLYIFYNMLEVGDRLLSAFGQDSIDSLFWTATEPKDRHRQHLGTIPHLFVAILYVMIHSLLVMFQASTLNVAINSNNKGLLTIMMSNNFVELKGSVFKKFDKHNLFQLTCSDVRERFQLTVLLLIVVLQTMKEFNWRAEQFFVMLPDCVYVLFTEILVDWIKHAFITRFNEIPTDVFRGYTMSLAYDMSQTRQKHAFSDHSDFIARRMGFIPYPLGIVLVKVIYHSVSITCPSSFLILLLGYIVLVSFRVLNTVYILGRACTLLRKHHDHKINVNTSYNMNPNNTNNYQHMNHGTSVMFSTPIKTTRFSAFEPVSQLSRKVTKTDISPCPSSIHSSTDKLIRNGSEFGATALFSNSDVILNESILNSEDVECDSINTSNSTSVLTRSVPNFVAKTYDMEDNDSEPRRTHKRSESEPSIQLDTSSN